MLFNIPFAIWLGILALISFFITLSLGIAMTRFKKKVFKYHRIFSYLTVAIVTIHVIFSILLWFFGIVI
jgi:hypothetical protein